MPDSHDPLRSLFREAASAGQAASTTPPVGVIERRGERHRRHRIVGIAAACLLVLAGSGAALSAFLPQDPGPNLPATTPSPVAPSPTSAPPRRPLHDADAQLGAAAAQHHAAPAARQHDAAGQHDGAAGRSHRHRDPEHVPDSPAVAPVTPPSRAPSPRSPSPVDTGPNQGR